MNNRLTKEMIKFRMYKPKKDFYIEKIGTYHYRLHLTPSDAMNSICILNRYFNLEYKGPGFYGSCYDITK